MGYNASTSDRRIVGRVVLVDALDRCVLLAEIAHVVVGTGPCFSSISWGRRPESDPEDLRLSQGATRMTGSIIDRAFKL